MGENKIKPGQPHAGKGPGVGEEVVSLRISLFGGWFLFFGFLAPQEIPDHKKCHPNQYPCQLDIIEPGVCTNTEGVSEQRNRNNDQASDHANET